MNDDKLLARVAARDAAALEKLIDRYGAYVAAVLRGRSGGALPPEDVEELAADVFLALWERAGSVRAGKLRPWLGAVSRNKAIERLRSLGEEPLPLVEDVVAVDGELWERVDRDEREALARALLSGLEADDREIFIRYYDLCQSTSEIAAILRMNPSTVKTRLFRGREKLRQLLYARGITL